MSISLARRRTLACLAIAIHVAAGASSLAAQQDGAQNVAPPASHRPAALVPLYVSFASLQAFDIDSTRKALNRGGLEANPIMRGVVGSPAAFIALKAAMTGATIASNETLWKRNRAAAVLMMVAMNGAYAAVVAHNYSVAR